MSFLKAVLLIMLVLLLMPSNSEEKYALYATAQRTIADIGGFCTRNPDVCERVSSGFKGIGQKLITTTDSIEGMLRDAGIGREPKSMHERDFDRYDRQSAVHSIRPAATPSPLNDTLTPKDRNPEWRGPDRM